MMAFLNIIYFNKKNNAHISSMAKRL